MNGLLWEYVTERPNLVWATQKDFPETLILNLKLKGCVRVHIGVFHQRAEH